MTPVQAELKKVRELHCRALALLLAKVPYVALEVFEELRRSHVLLEEPWNPEQVDAVVAVQTTGTDCHVSAELMPPSNALLRWRGVPRKSYDVPWAPDQRLAGSGLAALAPEVRTPESLNSSSS